MKSKITKAISFVSCLALAFAFAPVASADNTDDVLAAGGRDGRALLDAVVPGANLGSGNVQTSGGQITSPGHQGGASVGGYQSGDFDNAPGSNTTHADGNSCVAPEGNSENPDYFLNTGQALSVNPQGGQDTIIIEGGVPSPGETGPITFLDPPVYDGGSGGTQNHWSWGQGNTPPDQFLDGANCAAGCNPSGIDTVGNPLLGLGGNDLIIGQNDLSRTGLESIDDPNVLDHIPSNIPEAIFNLEQFIFNGQEVVLDPHAQPLE